MGFQAVTKDQRDEKMRATVAGGARGFLGGAAVALPASYLLQRRWPYYRALPPSLKALGVILVVVPSFVINAERSGLRYEREHRSDVGKGIMDAMTAKEDERWRQMTMGQKFGDFVRRYQFSFILGGWSIAMFTAWSIISKNPMQTTPQKVRIATSYKPDTSSSCIRHRSYKLVCGHRALP